MEKEELRAIREKVKELSEKFKTIKLKGIDCLDDDGCMEVHGCEISINEGENQIDLSLYGIEDIGLFENALNENNVFLNTLIGFHDSKGANLILHPLNYSGILTAESRLDKSNIEIEIMYKGKQIKATIGKLESAPFARIFYKGLQGIKSTNSYLLKIEPIDELDIGQIDNILLELSNSILFDLECSYGWTLKTVKTENFIKNILLYGKKGRIIPNEKIELQFKNYNPDLLEYFYTSELVSYLPFKYLCFYQILEYLLDKSAFLSAKKFITNRLKQPDYHLQKDNYIEEIVNLIRQENLKSATDLIKIQRVLEQYTSRKEIEKFINGDDLKKHFGNTTIFECGEELKLPNINLEGDKQFYDSLARRIFRVRCSIVHSNPDFDKKHAIPFVSTQKNLEKLRYEIELIQMIAKSIIVNESE